MVCSNSSPPPRARCFRLLRLPPAAAGTGSPAQAEADPIAAKTMAPLMASSVSPSGIPVFGGGAAPATPGGMNNSSSSNAADGGGGSSGVGGAGESGGSTAPPGGLGDPAGEGAEAGDGEWGSKMGLQLSALFVQRALMVFRRERAAMVRERREVTKGQMIRTII